MNTISLYLATLYSKLPRELVIPVHFMIQIYLHILRTSMQEGRTPLKRQTVLGQESHQCPAMVTIQKMTIAHLQDTNFDGVADTPAYNQYATYSFNRPIGECIV